MKENSFDGGLLRNDKSIWLTSISLVMVQDQPSLDDLREETWLPDAEEGITRGHEEFDTSFIPLNPPVTMQTRHYRSDTEVPEPRAQDIGVSRSRSSA